MRANANGGPLSATTNSPAICSGGEIGGVVVEGGHL